MSEQENIATREKILNAAEDIFLEKGKDGARMQMIADKADVNKAMLFYYFTNKDLLYKEVLKSNFYEMLNQLGNIIVSEGKPDQKIEAFVEAYISFFRDHPDLPKLMLREIAAGGETVKQMIHELKQVIPFRMPNTIIEFVGSGIKEGQFRDVDPKQTIISIAGMSLIYFLGKPLIESILNLEDINEQEFIEQRKESIVDLLRYGILIRSENESH